MKLAIFLFFVIFNCNVFSALHAKYFEIWKIFWELKSQLLHSTITQMVWYFWVFIWIHFPFYGVFFSQQYCVSFGLLVSCWVMMMIMLVLREVSVQKYTTWPILPWFHWSKSNFCSCLSQNDFKSPPSQFYVIYYMFSEIIHSSQSWNWCQSSSSDIIHYQV